MLVISRFVVLSILNYCVFITSPFIDTFQLINDLNNFIKIDNSDLYITYLFSSLLVSAVTILLIKIFKPFIEIYLLHYSRYFFYILVSLLGLSSVYIVLRVYGYSRISLIIYLFISSTFLNFDGKIIKFFR